MGFFDKLKSAIRKIKNKLIAFGVLFLIIWVWAIAPMSVAIKDALDPDAIRWI